MGVEQRAAKSFLLLPLHSKGLSMTAVFSLQPSEGCLAVVKAHWQRRKQAPGNPLPSSVIHVPAWSPAYVGESQPASPIKCRGCDEVCPLHWVTEASVVPALLSRAACSGGGHSVSPAWSVTPVHSRVSSSFGKQVLQPQGVCRCLQP